MKPCFRRKKLCLKPLDTFHFLLGHFPFVRFSCHFTVPWQWQFFFLISVVMNWRRTAASGFDMLEDTQFEQFFFEIYRNIDILCFQLEWETTFSFTTDTVKISKFSLNLWIFSGTVPKKIQKYRWQSIYHHVYFWIVFFTVHSFVKILNFSLFQCCINYKGNSGLSKC